MNNKQFLHYSSYIAALENYHCSEIGVEIDLDGLAKTIVDDIAYSPGMMDEEACKKQKETCKKLKIRPNRKLAKDLYSLCLKKGEEGTELLKKVRADLEKEIKKFEYEIEELEKEIRDNKEEM